ncbi:MAG: hypothetical protein FWB75_00710 [Oscillospiraceae bacterium]|nr:hypothetical protein [Oscillospiraceae bacterium]
MKRYLRLLLVSLCFIVVLAALSIVYGLIAHGYFTLRYVFIANFTIGVVLILTGILITFIPSVYSGEKNANMLDSSTFVERSYDSREKRQQKGRIVLWVGIFNIVLTGLVQILLSFIII